MDENIKIKYMTKTFFKLGKIKTFKLLNLHS